MLDVHRERAAHVSNESGDLVSRLADHEVELLLRAGLVANAKTVLGGGSLNSDLERHLRYDDAVTLSSLAKYEQGADLTRDSAFAGAAKLVMGQQYLVVPADVARGPRRVFSYVYDQPISWSTVTASTRWLTRVLPSSGTARSSIRLGETVGCRRYLLEAEAPYDSCLRYAGVISIEGVAKRICRRGERTLRYPQDNEIARPERAAVSLAVEFMAERTGVMRSAMFSLAFTFVILFIGASLAIASQDHALLAHTEDAGVAILLLFPGLVGGILASPGKHSLTTTLQFPTRLGLWAAGAISYFPAGCVALRVSGWMSLVVWWVSVALVGMLFGLVFRQWRRLKTERRLMPPLAPPSAAQSWAGYQANGEAATR
jgi:hypothetical protein